MPKSFTESLKAKLDELDVDRRVNELVAQAEDVVVRGVTRAGELTHEHRDQIDGLLDRAGSAVDRRTDGKYADRIGRVRSQVDRGVERLAEQRPGTDLGDLPGDLPADPPTDA